MYNNKVSFCCQSCNELTQATGRGLHQSYKVKKSIIVTELNSVTAIVAGNAAPASVKCSFIRGNVGFVGVRDVSSANRFVPGGFTRVGGSYGRGLGESRLRRGSVLFSVTNTVNEATVIAGRYLPTGAGRTLTVVEVPRNVVGCHCLLCTLRSSDVVRRFRGRGRKITRVGLSLGGVDSFGVPVMSVSRRGRVIFGLSGIDRLVTLRGRRLSGLSRFIGSQFVRLFNSPS